MIYTPGKLTLGFIPANRGCFSDELAATMRNRTVDAIQALGINVVVPGPQETKVGCVESRQEAEVCAELFRRKPVQGIVVGAVNFGEEQAVAWTMRQARLDVPVLIFGWGTGHAFGVAGAAMSTVVAIIVGVIWLSTYFLDKDGFLRFTPKEWKPDLAVWRRLLGIGMPA